MVWKKKVFRKRAKRPDVKSSMLLGVVTFLLSSCSFIRSLHHESPEDIIDENCSGFTFNYTEKFQQDRDSVVVYGKTRYCSTKGKAPRTTVSFYDGKDSLILKTKSDKQAYYQVKLKRGYYRMRAEGPVFTKDEYSGSINVPLMYIGTYGGCMQIDLNLLRHPLIIEKVPLSRSDIREIKRMNKESEKAEKNKESINR